MFPPKTGSSDSEVKLPKGAVWVWQVELTPASPLLGNPPHTASTSFKSQPGAPWFWLEIVSKSVYGLWRYNYNFKMKFFFT